MHFYVTKQVDVMIILLCAMRDDVWNLHALKKRYILYVESLAEAGGCLMINYYYEPDK